MSASSPLNILILYNETQTYTSTVHEHLESFARYSSSRVFFGHHDAQNAATDFGLFDAVLVHYSIRLPFDQIGETTAVALEAYQGLKGLFIQDEYDFTHRAWHWIRKLGIQLVFTSVPSESIERVYPPSEFGDVRFVNNLTGYVPLSLSDLPQAPPPSTRELVIGYRGRPLPIRYGLLCEQKTAVAQMVRAYCDSHGIRHDIEWNESARLYGEKWYAFIASCRGMLGTESGSNVFDWDGTLSKRIAEFRAANPSATDRDVYHAVIAAAEVPGLMNQVSPRIFEAIASRTALVLVEGQYSGVVKPHEHYIPLKLDGSNLAAVFEELADGRAVDEMTDRAFRDVIATGAYGYQAFVAMVDAAVQERLQELALNGRAIMHRQQRQFGAGTTVSTQPFRWRLPGPPSRLARFISTVSRWLPPVLKQGIRRLIKSSLARS